ncbi:MAG: peptidoglycan editing factor PgeF [Oscillospiraceae bacterium]|jgi:YfiH family protein|nr:peptidoglycan editing factor PgeF [Oscillospiraceae bacterium]
MSGFKLISSGGLTLCVPEMFSEAGIPCAFTTRPGGVSAGTLSSLNFRRNRDAADNFLKNIDLLSHAVGFDKSSAVHTSQVHGDVIFTVKRDSGGNVSAPTDSCDALITNETGVTLFAYTADCVPILLCDPAAKCVGAVHAGWRGTANGILLKTVNRMREEFGCLPQNILAAIGPAISQENFEVDGDVYAALKSALKDADRYIFRRGEKYFPDLKGLNRLWLEYGGVPKENIAVSGLCTYDNPLLFWSHRRDGDSRGCQAAVISPG